MGSTDKMLTIEQCRKLDPELETLSDKEMSILIKSLYIFIEPILDEYIEKI